MEATFSSWFYDLIRALSFWCTISLTLQIRLANFKLLRRFGLVSAEHLFEAQISLNNIVI